MDFVSIIVYTKRGCSWCEDLLDFLLEKKVEFEEREVRGNPVFFEEMISLSGQTKAPSVILNGKVYADTGKDEMEKILIDNKII